MRRSGMSRIGLVLAVLSLVFLFFSNCDLLVNKPEIDLEKAMDMEIAWATPSG